MKKTWDNIPDLNLQIDWDYDPSQSNKRKFGRLTENDIICILTGVKSINIKVVTKTSNDVYDGILKDLSAGGLCAYVYKDLPEYTPCKISFMLGRKKVQTRAIVCYSTRINGKCKIGFKFVDLDDEIRTLITDIYANNILTFGR